MKAISGVFGAHPQLAKVGLVKNLLGGF